MIHIIMAALCNRAGYYIFALWFLLLLLLLLLFGWRLGVVVSVVRRMNEVTVHWARLVLGWVTVFGRVYHHGM